MELSKLPDPRIQIEGTITQPDGTIVPFKIDTQPDKNMEKNDGVNTSDSNS